MDRFPGFELETDNLNGFKALGSWRNRQKTAVEIDADLAAGRGPGSDFLGWYDLPARQLGRGVSDLLEEADRARSDSDLVIVIGIGGSYLGARAAQAALGGRLSGPEIVFAGTGLGSGSLKRIAAMTDGRDFRLVVVSKSGTTLEPAVAFRYLRSLLETRYGPQQAAGRITAITDRDRGALRAMADLQGYASFVIPDDVGGRFSVLTPVGLLPLAMAGLDIEAMLRGAARMSEICRETALDDNPAHLYACARHALYAAGFTTEIMSSFNADLQVVQEWWKQLFGESEGKDGKGIFPASAVFTTDLHSLGQYVQDGRRDLFETFLIVTRDAPEVTVPLDADPGGAADRDRDGLGFLAGAELDWINAQAYRGTRRAHTDGGVPNMTIKLDRLDEATLGALFYFFQKAVAVSGRLLGVNPFDQPGVEAYKREMFKLLNKE